MKKLSVLLLLIFACFSFCGCTQALPASNEFIMLSLITSADGQMSQSLNFSLGTGKLEKAGASALEIEEVKKELIKNVTTFRDEFYISFMLIYNASPNEDFQIGKALLVSEVKYNKDSDTVQFALTFTSREAWAYYHPKSKEEGDGVDTDYGFMITQRSTGTFPFCGEIDTGESKMTVGQRYMNAYLNALSAAPEIKIDYKPDLVYNYGTPERSIKSDSEYYFTDDNQIYHHVWMRSSDEYLTKNSIEIYVSQPNRGVWYAIALSATLVVTGVAIAVVALKSKRARKNP